MVKEPDSISMSLIATSTEKGVSDESKVNYRVLLTSSISMSLIATSTEKGVSGESKVKYRVLLTSMKIYQGKTGRKVLICWLFAFYIKNTDSVYSLLRFGIDGLPQVFDDKHLVIDSKHDIAVICCYSV